VAEQVLLSWSGGKDSALTLAALRENPAFDVAGLLTSVTRDSDRVSIHGVRRSLLEAQARSVGLPLYEIVLEPRSSNAAFETAFLAGLANARDAHAGVRHVAFGDLFLEDVRAYRERLLAGTDLEPLFPIWGRPTRALAEEFINVGFEARLVCVDTTQIDARFTGRMFDRAFLAELPPTADPCGERGEFHTFVSKGPGFASTVRYTVGDVARRDDRFAYCDLLPGCSA
jgi:uncharacterized protein (TIGR00290 family)